MVTHSIILTLCVCVCAFCGFHLAELQLRILLNIYKIQFKTFVSKKNLHEIFQIKNIQNPRK